MFIHIYIYIYNNNNNNNNNNKVNKMIKLSYIKIIKNRKMQKTQTKIGYSNALASLKDLGDEQKFDIVRKIE